MRIVAKSLFLVGGLTSAVLLVSVPATAKEPQYLLNCRLIDHTSDLYRRYCRGEKPHSKIICQGDYCIIVVKNYVGRFGGNSELTLAVPDGPAINDGVTTASVSACPTLVVKYRVVKYQVVKSPAVKSLALLVQSSEFPLRLLHSFFAPSSIEVATHPRSVFDSCPLA